MRILKDSFKRNLIILGSISVIALGVACSDTAAPAAPVAPVAPAAPAAAAAAPAAPIAVIAGAPTAIPARPTATRVLPTATTVIAGMPVKGGTLIFAGAGSIDTLDPAYNSLFGGLMPMKNIYGSLFDTDENGNVIPDLAESWEFSADGKTVTAKMRSGVKFHDGTVADANAIKWNFDRMMDPEQGSPQRADLESKLASVEAPDSSTVVLTLIKAFRPFIPQIASERVGWTVSPTAVEKSGGGRNGDYGKNPVGTGPYKFVNWIPDQKVVFERNADFWDSPKPYLDGIINLALPDPGVRVAMLRTGEADYGTYTGVSGVHLPLLERSSKVKVIQQVGAGNGFFQFNTTIAPFDNKALRQAFAYAMDREALIIGAWGGVGKPGYLMTPMGWGFNPDLKPMQTNIEKAKEKMIEAGYPNGVTMPMGCAASGTYGLVCEVAQALVSEIGIKLEPKMILNNIYFNRQKGAMSDPGAMNRGWSVRVDPHTLLQFMGHSKGFHNLGAYTNPESDALIDQASVEYDTAKARLLYDKIHTILAEEAAMVWYLRRVNIFAMSADLMGFKPPMPPVNQSFRDVWFDR
jgi:peptide/nickel transport system substrate-binding protein